MEVRMKVSNINGKQNRRKGILLSTKAFNYVIFCTDEIYQYSYVDTTLIQNRIFLKKSQDTSW